MKPHEVPRVLLVEDDPTSRGFITAALVGVPGMVDVADSIAAASAHAASQRYDLLLIDAHLPDGSGAELLERLRRSGVNTPALAHTASADAALRKTLRAAGFLDGVVFQRKRQVLADRVRAGNRREQFFHVEHVQSIAWQ